VKLRNPNYTSAAHALANTKRAAVQAYLAELPAAQEFVSFDDIRASFPAPERAALTNGVLHQILQDLGHQAER
jgi:hypothetical protein